MMQARYQSPAFPRPGGVPSQGYAFGPSPQQVRPPNAFLQPQRGMHPHQGSSNQHRTGSAPAAVFAQKHDVQHHGHPSHRPVPSQLQSHGLKQGAPVNSHWAAASPAPASTRGFAQQQITPMATRTQAPLHFTPSKDEKPVARPLHEDDGIVKPSHRGTSRPRLHNLAPNKETSHKSEFILDESISRTRLDKAHHPETSHGCEHIPSESMENCNDVSFVRKYRVPLKTDDPASMERVAKTVAFKIHAFLIKASFPVRLQEVKDEVRRLMNEAQLTSASVLWMACYFIYKAHEKPEQWSRLISRYHWLRIIPVALSLAEDMHEDSPLQHKDWIQISRVPLQKEFKEIQRDILTIFSYNLQVSPDTLKAFEESATNEELNSEYCKFAQNNSTGRSGTRGLRSNSPVAVKPATPVAQPRVAQEAVPVTKTGLADRHAGTSTPTSTAASTTGPAEGDATTTTPSSRVASGTGTPFVPQFGFKPVPRKTEPAKHPTDEFTDVAQSNLRTLRASQTDALLRASQTDALGASKSAPGLTQGAMTSRHFNQGLPNAQGNAMKPLVGMRATLGNPISRGLAHNEGTRAQDNQSRSAPATARMPAHGQRPGGVQIQRGLSGIQGLNPGLNNFSHRGQVIQRGAPSISPCGLRVR